MARGHGRILSSIWEDADFLALTEQQQRLYLFLISQPNLNHAGLLPLTLRRWARKAQGLSPADLDHHLSALTDAAFIVMDEDTEELLIRSFVRNDGVWKQPKVMGAMVSGAQEISSPLLRHALLTEMDRIPLDELSDEPTKSSRGPGLSIRQQVAEHIEALRRAFRQPEPNPPAGGSATPSTPPPGTPSDPPAQGDREASTRARAATHAHAGTQARTCAPPLPLSPAPAPAPAPSLSPVPDASTERSQRERDADAIADAYSKATPGAPIPKHILQIRTESLELLAAGHTPDDLIQAVREMAPNGWRDIGRHLAHPKGPQLRAVSGDYRPFQCPPASAYENDLGF
ncbi:hypothetical protein I5Q34_33665 [Streptomyces sp. AV19]|uniref:hypothetical protein n=1 Tax=Streptomyces sp. AV19 TaxID=2793068 RepID=UPI0018FE3A11|nr:hypothetical protein [Streptomyces sp. AV19]MBH1939151.1 hypothetical protein [Streptomyces sp. AV19]MDG4535283.1 hypothetical protein [Streptomyces sp. AV19]